MKPENMKNKHNIDRDHYEQSPSTGREDAMLIMHTSPGYREVDR
jgi:hypothetical protein